MVLYNDKLFKKNKKLPKVFNPIEKASKLIIGELEAEEITSFITQSQNFQQQSASGSTSNMATITYVDQAVIDGKMDILGGASGAYDTLKELQTELEGNDSAITSIINTLGTKANQSDLTTTNNNLANITSRVGTAEINITTNIANITTLQSQMSSATTNINSLNSKTSALSTDSSGNTTISSKLYLNGGTNGIISLGDTNGDTINFIGQNISGLTKNHVGLSNIDNVSDLNKPISTATQSAINTINSSITSLNNKTSSLSIDASGNTTISSKLYLTGGTNGVVQLGDTSGDFINFVGQNISGLNKNHIGLNNVDNVSDLNKPISTSTQTALNLKADKTQIITTNQWNLNANVNMLSSVLSSIGSSTSQVINISGGTHTDVSGNATVNNLNAINLVMIGQDSGFSSPVSILNCFHLFPTFIGHVLLEEKICLN